MKFFKYSVLALALAVGFTSCSEDDDYVPGEASPGVYFPTNDPLEVALDRTKSSFEVIVARSGVTEAQTYNLIGDADSDVFTLPTSVSFAAGATTANVSIAYNQDAMAPDKAYDVVLSFASGITTSDYGYSSIEMSVILPAPWKTIGIGKYTDLYLLAMSSLSQQEGFDPTWEVEVQQHELDPMRFRWKSPYGQNFAKWCAANGVGDLDATEYDSKEQYSIEFICNPKVGLAIVPEQSLGFEFFSDGVMYVWNEAGMYYPANSYETITAQAAEACTQVAFEEVDDPDNPGQKMTTVRTVFSPEKVALVSFTPGTPEYYGGKGYQWVREGVDIKNYDLGIAYKGVLTTPQGVTNIFTEITLGADVATAKAAAKPVEDDLTTDDVIAGIIDGSIPSKTIEAKKSTVEFPFEGGGNFIVALVAYNEKGEVVSSDAIEIEVVDNSAPSDWQNVGWGTYTDMFVLPLYGARDFSWPVQVQQNKEDATLYRWVHPYGSAFKELTDQIFQEPWEADTYDSANVMYMNFIIENGLVAVPTQMTGCNLGGQIGQLSAGNMAGLYVALAGWSFDDILGHPQLGEAAFSTATFDGGKLTSVVQPANCTALVFESDDPGSYHTLKDETGGVQWESSAMEAAPAKMPSLKAAINSMTIRYNDNEMVRRQFTRTFCGKPYVKK
ncbi:MAG: hypothetical protein K2M12_10680 [Muribaculaceae bacterium]|nr:hypothetical protein [Muribaculaceae bacterium]